MADAASQQDQHATAAPETDLSAACDAAMAGNFPLDLRGLTCSLSNAAIHVRKGCLLILQGPATIIGHGHSIFQVSGRGRLELRFVHLIHRCKPLPAGETVERRIPGQGDVVHISSENDITSVGACVFVTNKGSALLDGCSLSSVHGLGIWLVQRAKCEVRGGCELGPVARSGVALFGQASAVVSDSTIHQCAMHGACARGTAKLDISRCTIEDCGRRGAYAYQRASMAMEDCVVRGTGDPTRAAIEAAGCREGDAVLLSLRRCRLHANAGAPLRVSGAVEVHMDRDMEEMMACDAGHEPVAPGAAPCGCAAVIRGAPTDRERDAVDVDDGDDAERAQTGLGVPSLVLSSRDPG